ncbi:MAG TPA: tetratricopeptide repeat protein [bacterium]|nr:tetratricopeptide repeat protein [bacterium]HPT29588.1 tetratricopeptide repeat protein [bacterium]
MKKWYLFLVLAVVSTAVFAQKGKTNKVDSLKNEIKIMKENYQKSWCADQAKMGLLYLSLAKEKFAQAKYGAAAVFADSAINCGQAAAGAELKGMCLFNSGRYTDAANSFLESVKIEPGYSNNFHLGVCYYKLDQFLNAQKVVDAMLAAQKFRQDTMSYYYLGRSYYQLEMYAEAATSFENLLSFQRSYDIYFSAGMSYYYLGKYDKVVSFLKPAYHLKATDPVLLKTLGISLVQIGKTKEGVEILQKLLKLK